MDFFGYQGNHSGIGESLLLHQPAIAAPIRCEKTANRSFVVFSAFLFAASEIGQPGLGLSLRRDL